MVDLFNQLTYIFGETSGAITLAVLITGLILVLFEFFVPGFSVFGILGIVISLGGVVYRIIAGLNTYQIAILIVVWGLTILACYLLFIHSAKSGLLSRSKLFSEKPSLPYDFDDDVEKKLLLGKTGVTTTRCKPVGKAEIDGKEYEVLAENSYLDKDTNIKVIKITNDNVVVSKF